MKGIIMLPFTVDDKYSIILYVVLVVSFFIFLMFSTFSTTIFILFDLLKLNSLLAFHISSIAMSEFKKNIPVNALHQDNVYSLQNEFVTFYCGESCGTVLQSGKYFYVFGYGSLIWRPGEYLDQYYSYRAHGIGWRRMFAQRSTDHRGTSSFPGLVLNLVQDRDDAESTNLDFRQQNGAYCKGLVWLIPSDYCDIVVDYLDEREKGGYSRSIIDVQLNEDSMLHPAGATIQALSYIGQSDNPFFYLPRRDLDASLEIISAAYGPSGANSDYLLNLVSFLEARNMSDLYLTSLANKVRLRIGPWRLADNSRRFARPTCPEAGGGRSTFFCARNWPVLLGWGSNEFQQLGSRAVIEHDHIYTPMEIHINSANSDCPVLALPSSVESTPAVLVVAGGGTTACIQNHLLRIWGSMLDYLLPLIEAGGGSSSRLLTKVTIREVENVAIGHDHMLILLTSGKVVAIGNNSHGQCAGPSTFALCQGDLVLVEESNSNSESVFSFQRKQRLETLRLVGGTVNVLKLATGLRHSAAITSDGSLYTWGDCSHDQVLQTNHNNDGPEARSSVDGEILLDSVACTPLWRPPSGAKLVDVCCGAKHTVVVDTAGRIWTFGNNKYGSLGRNTASSRSTSTLHKGVPEIVEGLLEGVMWQRVSCGWSHTVARGVDDEGRLVFYSWGRRDMNQYVADDSGSGGHGPFPLQQLPDSLQLTEVWCGSEFTIAADEHGGLWGCGWNEHGNLGCGRDSSTTSAIGNGWRRVHKQSSIDANEMTAGIPSSPTNLTVLWEGALSCGGSHVITLK